MNEEAMARVRPQRQKKIKLQNNSDRTKPNTVLFLPKYESFVKHWIEVLAMDFGLELLLPVWQ
jgi:hypothetical protein